MARHVQKKQTRMPFFHLSHGSAATRADRRRRRGPGHGGGRHPVRTGMGKGSYLRNWPTTKTQKAGKNAGKAPRYDARPADR